MFFFQLDLPLYAFVDGTDGCEGAVAGRGFGSPRAAKDGVGAFVGVCSRFVI